MQLDDIYTTLSEFNKRVKELEGLPGDPLVAKQLKSSGISFATKVDPYILKYPYKYSSVDEAILMTKHVIGEDIDLDDDVIQKSVSELAQDILLRRLETSSFSTMGPDVYRSIENNDNIKLWLKTDRSSVVITDSLTETLYTVHVPNQLPVMLQTKTLSCHDGLWKTFLNQIDHEENEENFYDMGLIKDSNIEESLANICKQIENNDKVIAI